MRVPVYESQTQVEGLPGARSDVRVSGDSFLNNNLMTSGSAVGKGLEHANRAAAALYSQQVEEANRTRALDAVNQFEQVRQDRLFGKDGAFSVKGADVFARPDSVSLADGVKADLTSAYQGISDSLSNDAQRKMFASHALSAIQQSYGQTLQHEGEQFKVYRQGVNQAAINTNANNIALNYNNLDEISKNIDAIHVAALDLAKSNGFPDSYAINSSREQISNAIQSGIGAALQHGNSYIAKNLLDKFGDIMNGNDRINVQQKISDSAASALIMVDPYAAMRMYEKSPIEQGILYAEGGSDTFDENGQPAVSTDGQSIGRYQVTDATAQNPGFGIAPAANRSHAEYNRIGHELIGKLEEKYNGDGLKVAAAYNAGSGAVDAAIEKGGDEWAKFIPRSTREQYLPNVVKGMVTGSPLDLATNQDRRRYYIEAKSMAEQGRARFSADLSGTISNQIAQAQFTGSADNLPYAEFVRAYAEKAPERYAEYQDNLAFGKNYYAVKNMSHQDQTVALNQIIPQKGAVDYDTQAKNYDALQKSIIAVNKKRAEDPMGFALQQSNLGLKPLNTGNIQQLTQDLRERNQIAYQISNMYGTPLQIMSDKEATDFSKSLYSQLPQDKASTLKQIFNAVGPQGMLSISKQLKSKNDELAIAGMLTSYTEPTATHWIGPDTGGRNAAELYLDGKAALSENRVKVDNTKEIGTKAEIYKALQDVYQTPQGMNAAAEAAFGIWAKFKSENIDDVQKAVDIATGGIMDHNGAKIAKPYGMKDSQFSDLMISAIPAQIRTNGGDFMANGHALTADEFAAMLPGARLKTYGQGSYLVMSGSDVVRKPDGSAYVLDINKPASPGSFPEPPQGWEKIQGEYDTEGYISKYGKPDQSKGQHLTDEYKLPNHITFSTGSRYSNPRRQGGEWSGSDTDGWEFRPSEHNLKTYSRAEIEDYFRNRERKNTAVVFSDGKRVQGSL